jgi:transposase InsO family protein
LLPQRDGGGGDGPRLDPILKERFHALYMSQKRITVATARDVLAGHLILEQSELQDHVPSLATFHRYVQTIPLQARILAREGSDAYRRKCQPFLPRDFNDYRVMQRWVADHYNFKLWVYHEGRVFRPWLTQWLDVRSRRGLGEYIGDGPSQETVLASLADGVIRYGAPEELWTDNGREFSSPNIAGKSRRWRVKIDAPRVQALVTHLEATWHFSIPKEPQSRGVIERWFGVTLERFDKLFPSYCGRDISEKPDDLNQLLKTPRALPTLTEVRQKFRIYMDQVANETPSEGQGMDNQSPRVVFESHAYEKRTATKEALSLLFMRSPAPVRIGQNGIKVFDRYYGGIELAPHFGQQAYYRFDPADLGELYVFSFPEERYLCTVRRRDASGVTSEDYRRIQHEKKVLRKITEAYRVKREAHAATPDPIAALAAQRGRQAEERGDRPVDQKQNQVHRVVRPIARGLETAARQIREERAKRPATGDGGRKATSLLDRLAARDEGRGTREESGEEKATRMLDRLAKFSGIGGT